jgi:myo-inositol 2-dehydrogenase/D-chiro-inositol 1-dehydrogenase
MEAGVPVDGDPDRELRVGVIGAGWAGGEHAASISALGGARVCAVADVELARARALADRFDAQAHGEVTPLLAQKLDAVIVATPPGEHASPTISALEAGAAVLLEKPLARTADDARAIAAAVRRTGGVCAVGYQWRALDILDGLRAHLRGQEPALLVSQGIGITQARSWFTDPRQSGRLVSERASHHVDLQRAIVGEVATVHAARGGVSLSGHRCTGDVVEDVISLNLRFAEGALGAIHIGWTPDGYPGRQSLDVFATEGAFHLALDPTFTLQGRSREVAIRAEVREHPFLREMRLFFDAVRAGEPDAVACGVEDAAATLAVALAAEESLRHGGPVRIADIIPRHPETDNGRPTANCGTLCVQESDLSLPSC